MSREAAQYRIAPDHDGSITKWVCDGLGENTDWVGGHVTMAVYLGGRLVAGIIFNDIRPGTDVWLTIYSTDRRWCCRRVLHCVFGLVFDEMKCRRCSAFVSRDNHSSRNLVEKLGFVREGLLRQYADDGQDRFVYGMLEKECRWRKK